jgi:hypothetical protein
VQPPVACSLGTEDARERVEEWRRFFDRSVVGVEYMADERVRFLLGSNPGELTDAVDLAQREKACCPFFDFSIQVEPDRCWLVVAVPAEATAVLADFTRLAGSHRA